MDYPNNLYTLRNSLRKSQGDMAELLNISQSEYSRLEKGKRRLGVHEMPLKKYFMERGVMSEADSLVETATAEVRFNTLNSKHFDNHKENDNQPLPVYGTPTLSGGIKWTKEAVDMIERVPSLKDNIHAYVACVSGDDMKPRLLRGYKAVIDPTSTPVHESLVLVEFKNESGVRYFREFVSSDSQKITLKTYNPEVVNEYKHSEILNLHKVFGLRL
jgi:transcriptional regulator with XRE-family HTH domain